MPSPVNVGGALGLAAVLLAASLMPTPGLAHSWYSRACCGDQDCRPTAPGEVEFRPDGWFISSAGKLVPFGDDKIKASQDHRMHVCTYSTGAVRVRCLYVPDPRT
jgi:hypothetical protein